MSQYLRDGVLDLDDFELPSKQRREKGRVIIIECVQEIPCNPCSEICPRNAITIKGDITNIPQVDFEKCNGCGICIANCPGLAIFSVNESLGQEMAEVGIPYEFKPLPETGDSVDLIDRAGQVVGTGTVKRVLQPKSYDRTALIYLMVPRELSLQIRFFRKSLKSGNKKKS